MPKTRAARTGRPVAAGDAELPIDALHVGPSLRLEGLDARHVATLCRARRRVAAHRGAAGRPVGGRRTAPRRRGPAAGPGDAPCRLVRRHHRRRLRRVRALQRGSRIAPRSRRAAVGGQPDPALAPGAFRPERRFRVRRVTEDGGPAAPRARRPFTPSGADSPRRSGRAGPPDRSRRAAGAHHRGTDPSAGGVPSLDRRVRRFVARDRAQRAREAEGCRRRRRSPPSLLRSTPTPPCSVSSPDARTPATGWRATRRSPRAKAAASSSTGSTGLRSSPPTTGPTSGACH